MYTRAALALSLAAAARSQLAGTQVPEVHPALTWSKCTGPGACSQQNGEIVIDANWRWLHNAQGSNCYTGNTWDATSCPDDQTCAANCELEGANYQSTYGVSTSGDSVSVGFVTHGAQTNVGSRFYLMATDESYEEFNLLNSEFTFDVDVSGLPCGLNGAVYFVNMEADGGMASYPTNKAGAKYGTGYCDSQCPRDLKFINGEANVEGWQASSNDPNSGIGNHGSCCAEMDIWEANSMSTALTPHSCETVTQHMCEGDACGGTYSSSRYGGDCDPDGCDFNPYRQGNESFYGMGKIVDTTKPFTITTQFLTGSDGTLNEIKRFYTQNGVKIDNAQSDISGVTGNSITEAYCDAQKSAFGDPTSWQDKGGFASMSSAMSKGMVLVMSLWDDHYADMLWLDSTYPTNKTSAGGPRGSCATNSGVPATIENSEGNSKVIYSNIKFGPIGSTA